MSGKKIYWFTGFYVLILIAAVVLFYVVPNENPVYQEMSPEDLVKAEQVNFEIGKIETVSKEKLSHLEGVYKKGELNYQYSENELEIPSLEGMGIQNIFVERKETNDNKIQVFLYTTKTIFNKYDVTDAIKPPRVQLQGNRLNFITPEKVEIHIARFTKEFTIAQFSDEKGLGVDPNTDVMGTNVIYLLIPKNVQLLNDQQMGVYYVGGK